MNAADRWQNYLTELRDEVCTRCAGRPNGEPVTGPADTPCGRHLQLSQLVFALTNCPNPNAAEREEDCPCSKDRLADLALIALDEMEHRRVLRERMVQTWDD